MLIKSIMTDRHIKTLPKLTSSSESRTQHPEQPNCVNQFVRHLLLMLKYTLKYWVPWATIIPARLGGSKKRWRLNKIKLTWEKQTIFHLEKWWTATLFYDISRSIWDHCPIRSKINKTISIDVRVGCQETGALWLFALWDIVLKKGNNKLINPI